MEAVDDPAAPRRLLSRVPAEDETRAALATEVFSAALGLVQPQLEAYTALREAEAAVRAGEEALGEAQRAEGEARAAHEALVGSAGEFGSTAAEMPPADDGAEPPPAPAEGSPEAEAAAAAAAAEELAAAAAKVEEAAAAAAAAREQLGAAEAARGAADDALPLPLLARALRLAHRMRQEAAFDALLPALLQRSEDRVAALEAEEAAAKAAAVPGTEPAKESTAAGTLALPGFGDDADPAEEAEAFAMDGEDEECLEAWSAAMLLQCCRQLEAAAEGEAAAEAAASLAALLKRAMLSSCTSLALARLKDGASDAALLLWAHAVPRLDAQDKAACGQRPGDGAGLRLAGAAALSMVVRVPKPEHAARLGEALAALGRAAGKGGFTYALLPGWALAPAATVNHLGISTGGGGGGAGGMATGGAVLHGKALLQLEIVCDRLRDKHGIECVADAPTAPRGAPQVAGLGGGRASPPVDGSEEAAEAEAEAMRVLLVPAFHALLRGELHDPLLMSAVALRLQPLLLDAGRLREASSVCRAALALVVAERGAAVVRFAEKGIDGAPSVSAASVLQPEGGPAPFAGASHKSDMAQRNLASSHVELLVWLLRTELRRGIQRAGATAAVDFGRARVAQAKRRGQQHIYGRKWAMDKEREAAEDAAVAEAPATAAAAEARLLAEYAHEPYTKALLLVECARYRATPDERQPLLIQAAEALHAAAAVELGLAQAVAPSAQGRPRPSQAPPPPQLVYRTASEVCLRPRPYAPLKKAGTIEAPRVASYAVYGKAAGASGVAVSLNNVDFRGCGEPRPLGGGEDDYDPMAGTIVLRGLPLGGPCVFAVAAYDAGGGLIGTVGATSAPIVAALPLPRLHIWATLALSAAQLGCEVVALAAAAQVEGSLVARSPPMLLWEQNPAGRLRLQERMARHSAAAELRVSCQAILLAVSLRAEAASPGGAGVSGSGDAPGVPPLAVQVETLVLAKLQLLALQLALAIDDAALSAAALQGLWNLIVPLLRLRTPSAFLLHPLCSIVEVLQLLPPERLVAIRRAPQLLACAAFALVRLSQQAGLGALADHVAQTDVRGFAQKLATEYAAQAAAREAQGVAGAAAASAAEVEADALMAAMLREHVASDAALTLPAPDDSAPSPSNDDIGLVVWGSLRTAADAAWAQVEAFKEHPRQLEFGVRVCEEMLRGKQNAQTAAAVRAMLDTLLAAAKAATRQKTRAEASSRPATADADAAAGKGGKVPPPPHTHTRAPHAAAPAAAPAATPAPGCSRAPCSLAQPLSLASPFALPPSPRPPPPPLLPRSYAASRCHHAPRASSLTLTAESRHPYRSQQGKLQTPLAHPLPNPRPHRPAPCLASAPCAFPPC